MDSIRSLPGYHDAADTTTLLSPERIAKYAPPSMARDWTRYIDHSAAQHARDTAAMNAELRAARATKMTRAPYVHDFSMKPSMTRAWLASDSGRRLADNILSFQAPNGGWSKHVDFTLHTRGGGESYFGESDQWQWISTIDNNATTEEIRFLAKAGEARGDVRFDDAVRRGVDYVLAAQMPNGCFPQVYPLEGSYHDAATYNDNATTNVLRLLLDVAGFNLNGATADQSARASAAIKRGVECILDSQVRVRGRLTIWAQQQDPLTFRPVSARSYELASLAPQESAAIVSFLMELPGNTPRVNDAVYSATDWFRAHTLTGLSYSNYQLRENPDAGPLWGRMIEIDTDRPIMANRDGTMLYDWEKLTDRRSGYSWYTTAPAATLARLDDWAKSHPRAP